MKCDIFTKTLGCWQTCIGLIIVIVAIVFPLRAVGAEGDNSSFCGESLLSPFGLRAGFGFDFPNSFDENEVVDTFSPGLSLSVGGVYRYRVYQFLFLHSGMAAAYDAYQMKDVDNSKHSIRKLTLSIPINIGLMLDYGEIKVLMNTGPTLSIGVLGKIRKQPDFSQSNPAGWENLYSVTGSSRFDVLWNGDIGVSYSKWYCGLNATIGLGKQKTPLQYRYHDLTLRLVVGRDF